MPPEKLPVGAPGSQSPAASGPFPRTDWQRLEDLREGSEDVKRAVFGEMFVRYREPILAFLQHKGCSFDRAEGIVQDFFMYSIQHRLFEKADPQRGRFRNLMLKALNPDLLTWTPPDLSGSGPISGPRRSAA